MKRGVRRQCLPSRKRSAICRLVRQRFPLTFFRSGDCCGSTFRRRSPVPLAAGQRAVGRPDAPGREPQHPSNILGRNQMPRRPHHMRPSNLAPLQRPVDGAQRGGAQPDSDSPADRLVVLCLNGSHPSHERTRICSSADRTAAGPTDGMDVIPNDFPYRERLLGFENESSTASDSPNLSCMHARPNSEKIPL